RVGRRGRVDFHKDAVSEGQLCARTGRRLLYDRVGGLGDDRVLRVERDREEAAGQSGRAVGALALRGGQTCAIGNRGGRRALLVPVGVGRVDLLDDGRRVVRTQTVCECVPDRVRDRGEGVRFRGQLVGRDGDRTGLR